MCPRRSLRAVTAIREVKGQHSRDCFTQFCIYSSALHIPKLFFFPPTKVKFVRYKKSSPASKMSEFSLGMLRVASLTGWTRDIFFVKSQTPIPGLLTQSPSGTCEGQLLAQQAYSPSYDKATGSLLLVSPQQSPLEAGGLLSKQSRMFTATRGSGGGPGGHLAG